ncbi:MAG: DUF4377 domain-containing protein [Cryomorphaceae bacterium]|nr:DUF4377 domain-containing protein [Cryomorphaceae bacterium]
MNITLTSLILVFANITFAQTVNYKTITVDPYLSFQNYEHFKRLTLRSPDSDATYIEGFEFLWGYTYKLSVKEVKLGSNLSDGTRYEYALEKIIAKTKASDSAQFKLFLDPNRYYHKIEPTEQEMNNTLRQINDSTFSYFDQVEIEVPSHILEEFKSMMGRKIGKMGLFVYVNEKRIRLVKLQ